MERVFSVARTLSLRTVLREQRSHGWCACWSMWLPSVINLWAQNCTPFSLMLRGRMRGKRRETMSLEGSPSSSPVAGSSSPSSSIHTESNPKVKWTPDENHCEAGDGDDSQSNEKESCFSFLLSSSLIAILQISCFPVFALTWFDNRLKGWLWNSFSRWNQEEKRGKDLVSLFHDFTTKDEGVRQEINGEKGVREEVKDWWELKTKWEGINCEAVDTGAWIIPVLLSHFRFPYSFCLWLIYPPVFFPGVKMGMKDRMTEVERE